jgi:hypothetical protein
MIERSILIAPDALGGASQASQWLAWRLRLPAILAAVSHVIQMHEAQKSSPKAASFTARKPSLRKAFP